MPDYQMRKTVLIIDSDPSFCDRIGLFISGAGCLVQAARNPVSALQIVDTDAPPDAVILDLHLPGLELSEFTRTLYNRNPKADLILTCTQNTPSGGRHIVLVKPIDPQKLLRSIGVCVA